MKFIPALVAVVLLAAHAQAEMVPVQVDAKLPPLYYEAESSAAAENFGNGHKQPLEPPIALVAWADVRVTYGTNDCSAACGLYRLSAIPANLATGANPLCRPSITSSSYGSEIDGMCSYSNGTTGLTADPYFCGCCGVINKEGIPFNTGCLSVVNAGTPGVGGGPCPAPQPPATSWGFNETTTTICATLTTSGLNEFGTIIAGQCATFDANAAPGIFAKICYTPRTYSPPTPPFPGHGNQGRKML